MSLVSQAETQLQPWTGKDDLESQKAVWRVNTRIVSMLSALLRLWTIPFIVKVVVGDGAVLRRATDGLTIDGEACTLPQLEVRYFVFAFTVKDCKLHRLLLRLLHNCLLLEWLILLVSILQLLEGASLAAQAALKWDEPHEDVPNRLFSLLKVNHSTTTDLKSSTARPNKFLLALLQNYFDLMDFKI